MTEGYGHLRQAEGPQPEMSESRRNWGEPKKSSRGEVHSDSFQDEILEGFSQRVARKRASRPRCLRHGGGLSEDQWSGEQKQERHSNQNKAGE